MTQPQRLAFALLAEHYRTVAYEFRGRILALRAGLIPR